MALPGGKEVPMMQKVKNAKELARKMYLYFVGFDEAWGAPSFTKFAKLSGLTLEQLLAMRRVRSFERAYAECSEIRRDYLIDRALTKRFDPSFVKYLIDAEAPSGGEDSELSVRLEVCE